jgi:hypothetical protein
MSPDLIVATIAGSVAFTVCIVLLIMALLSGRPRKGSPQHQAYRRARAERAAQLAQAEQTLRAAYLVNRSLRARAYNARRQIVAEMLRAARQQRF